MKKLLLLITALLLCASLGLPALAQQQGQGSGGQYSGQGMMRGQGNMMGPGQGKGQMRGMYGQGMMGPSAQGWQDMTPEQRTQFQQMHGKYLQDTMALRQKLAGKKIELQTMWSQPNPDQAKIDALAKEVAGLRSQLSQQRDQFLGTCRQKFGDKGWACPGMGY